MRDVLSKFKNSLYVVLGLFLVLFIIATGNSREVITASDVNQVKSIQAVHIVNKYNNLLENIKPAFAANMNEVMILGPTKPVIFTATMTGYGPDCEGCGGRVGCPPRQDVRNGNIYFEDKEYGKIRIIATDKAIPCGSIVRITNSKESKDPIMSIVLDRGGAIKGNKVDLLFASEKDTTVVGKQNNVQFEIVRWGW